MAKGGATKIIMCTHNLYTTKGPTSIVTKKLNESKISPIYLLKLDLTCSTELLVCYLIR